MLTYRFSCKRVSHRLEYNSSEGMVSNRDVVFSLRHIGVTIPIFMVIHDFSIPCNMWIILPFSSSICQPIFCLTATSIINSMHSRFWIVHIFMINNNETITGFNVYFAQTSHLYFCTFPFSSILGMIVSLHTWISNK